MSKFNFKFRFKENFYADSNSIHLRCGTVLHELSVLFNFPNFKFRVAVVICKLLKVTY